MKAPKKLLKSSGLASAALCVALATAHAGQITASGSTEADWISGDYNYFTVSFNINSDGLVNGIPGLSISDFLDDRSVQSAMPFGNIGADAPFSLSSTFLRSGATVSSSLSYGISVDFLNLNNFENNATDGTDNYDGISYSDGSGNTYYGWMQFQLQQFQAGATGVNFISGYLSDTPNTPVTAGLTPVPEPTTLALAGLGGIALLFRKRK